MSCGDSSTLLKDTGLTNQVFFFSFMNPGMNISATHRPLKQAASPLDKCSLKKVQREIFQALQAILSLSQLLSSAILVQKQP